MRYILFILHCSLLLLLTPVEGHAQSSTAPATQDEELYALELQSRLQLFLDAWQGMSADLQYCSSNDLPNMEDRMKQLDAKWLLYSQAQQMDISVNDSLLEVVGNIQVIRQAAQEQLEKAGRKVRLGTCLVYHQED